MSSFALPSLINGRFTCSTEILGEGIEGQVRSGRDVTTNEPVALKLVNRSRMNVNEVERLDLEINILVTLRHPNIVALKHAELYAQGQDGFVATILVMEKASCELFDYLMTGPFSDSLSRTYFQQLLSALHACHSVGIFHRDIKPENLLVGSDFSLKIADFGWASNRDSVLNTVCGTASYMAPEILANRPYRGAEVDLWSAACVLFIMLSGVPPFEKAAQSDWWFNAITHSRYDRFWAAHFRSAPHMESNAVACDLIVKMLRVNPAERLTLEQAAGHTWFDGQFLNPTELAAEMNGKRERMEAIQTQEKARKAQERAQLIAERGAAAAAGRHGRAFDAFVCDTTRAVSKPPVYSKGGSPTDRGPYSILYSACDGTDLLFFIQRALKEIDSSGHLVMDGAEFTLDATVKVGGGDNKTSDTDILLDGDELPPPPAAFAGGSTVALGVQIFSAPAEEASGGDTTSTTTSNNICFAEISRKQGDVFGFRELIRLLKESVEKQEQAEAEAVRKGLIAVSGGSVGGVRAIVTEDILQDDIGMV